MIARLRTNKRNRRLVTAAQRAEQKEQRLHAIKSQASRSQFNEDLLKLVEFAQTAALFFASPVSTPLSDSGPDGHSVSSDTASVQAELAQSQTSSVTAVPQVEDTSSESSEEPFVIWRRRRPVA